MKFQTARIIVSCRHLVINVDSHILIGLLFHTMSFSLQVNERGCELFEWIHEGIERSSSDWELLRFTFIAEIQHAHIVEKPITHTTKIVDRHAVEVELHACH